MGNYCKNICNDMAVKRIADKGHSMYVDNKHCSLCRIFIKTDEICCPCCKARLGTRPKTKREREVYENHIKTLLTTKIRSKK